MTFKNTSVGLLIGIGGSVPHITKQDVRLGDVVVGPPEVGPAVVQYDLGKLGPSSIEVTRTLNKAPALLQRVVDKVENEYDTAKDDGGNFFATHIQRFATISRMKDSSRHASMPNQLFLSNYNHGDGTQCSSHDKAYEVERPAREPAEIRVHYSTILSGDFVMKSREISDEISAKFHDALCFKMKAAGLMDTFPCLVIRGICDYSDSRKNKDWQEYGAAAAYAREILLYMSEKIFQDLKNSEALSMEPVAGNTKAVAMEARDNQKVYSSEVTFSRNNNSGFQLGQTADQS